MCACVVYTYAYYGKWPQAMSNEEVSGSRHSPKEDENLDQPGSTVNGQTTGSRARAVWTVESGCKLDPHTKAAQLLDNVQLV